MTAEEFYKNLGPSTVENGVINKMKYEFGLRDYSKLQDLLRFAEAYHAAKMAEVTDEDIEEWACKNKNISLSFSAGMSYGAKAFRDGKIKHIEK